MNSGWSVFLWLILCLVINTAISFLISYLIPNYYVASIVTSVIIAFIYAFIVEPDKRHFYKSYSFWFRFLLWSVIFLAVDLIFFFVGI